MEGRHEGKLQTKDERNKGTEKKERVEEWVREKTREEKKTE